ncbi:hypothetical protein CERZMDRAFT_48104 [Cercospora zeae-maydis SCOH1-5]|uniref:Uncharacterized protein n=1 Tax=Cercospora zeae-maydis SCOH1-5 TaxID=717836 RepID=A0A6A6F867_9PEZI|nr:hypothetical protein CERZMDRAFT_48104 [Cercospora zeae-maydis SCOH1-5]
MCSYSFLYYYCGCDIFMLDDSIEYCGNRYLNGYSVEIWSADMCKDRVVTCNGRSRWYCSECSEDHTLEYELEE